MINFHKAAADAAEITLDITDILHDVVDPENECGAVATAYFSTNTSGFISMDGFAIEEGATTIYRPAEATDKIFGDGTWCRLTDIAQEQHDDTHLN